MKSVTISNEFLTVVIASKGAEIQSVTDRNGNERMWQGDPAFWTGRAPIMFPVCGGYKDDCYTMRGERYPMNKHGFARLKEWQPGETAADRATFILTEKEAGFPFEYEFRAVYALEGESLRVTYEVENRDSRIFHFGVGSHEAYALEGPLEDYRIEFPEEEDLRVSKLIGNLIDPEPYVLKEKTRTLELKTEFFAVDALVFRSLRSRSATLMNTKTGRNVRVDFEGMDVFMLWQKPGAGYLCLEPWTNAPDTLDTDGEIEHKPGMICLQPGETARRSHLITFG